MQLKEEHQIHFCSSFQDLLDTSFKGPINAMCCKRELLGDFSEIVQKIRLKGNMVEISPKDLLQLKLSKQGELARNILLEDLKALKAHGASPILNVIKQYDRDDSYPFFPTDVYSFHVDRSPVPTHTFLCTYHGAPSEIIPNAQAEQKIQVAEIRAELQKLYTGTDEGFESFLEEYFFDLHYQAKPNATVVSLGIGNIWKLAVDHPQSKGLPCIHRAPAESDGQKRLLLIC